MQTQPKDHRAAKLQMQETLRRMERGYSRVFIVDQDDPTYRGLDVPLARSQRGAIHAIVIDLNKKVADHHKNGHWTHNDVAQVTYDEEHKCWLVALHESAYGGAALPGGPRH